MRLLNDDVIGGIAVINGRRVDFSLSLGRAWISRHNSLPASGAGSDLELWPDVVARILHDCGAVPGKCVLQKATAAFMFRQV